MQEKQYTRNEKYTVTVSTEAMNMLMEHVEFLAQVSETAAMRLISQFQAYTEKLETMPEAYPWLYDTLLPEHKYRKVLFERRYLIVYQIEDNNVYIDAVVDCREEYQKFL
jgi:plasmid stabilization system protein ParE